MAAEICDGKMQETEITLTPVHDGRFEIYLDGQKVYDRKEAGAGDIYNGLKEVRKVKSAFREAMEKAPAKA